MKKDLTGCLIVGVSVLVSSCNRGDSPSREMMAVRHIAEISHAERQAFADLGHYLELSDLEQRYTSRITPDLERESRYEFKLKTSPRGYTLKAVPLSERVKRSFFCDESGVIRQDWPPAIADAGSPPMK